MISSWAWASFFCNPTDLAFVSFCRVSRATRSASAASIPFRTSSGAGAGVSANPRDRRGGCRAIMFPPLLILIWRHFFHAQRRQLRYEPHAVSHVAVDPPSRTRPGVGLFLCRWYPTSRLQALLRTRNPQRAVLRGPG